MPENAEAWWARRQWSKGAEIPYPIGTFRDDWQRYPVLIRQYHPDLNHGIALTQVPPAAEVYLVWQCDAGHHFVATPEEQRMRPTGSRRRSTWCPECALLAKRRATPKPAPLVPAVVDGAPATPVTSRDRPSRTPVRRKALRPSRPAGTAFHSERAPKPASAAEADLRQRLATRLPLDPTLNAVAVSRPFFERYEVWPDILFPDLRIAIEYDTTGRDGLEHVGLREDVDRRKDRLLRSSGWEVVRIRCGKLLPIGPFDIVAAGVSSALIERLIDRLRQIRGELIVNAYLEERAYFEERDERSARTMS
ncbi:hypothetical protein BH09ACT1_BH09ACT1_21880 [soil metagenome]